MRKRYRQGREVPVTYTRDVYPLAMGDGTFVLVSGLEKLQGITPNEIRAQEAQEEALAMSLDKKAAKDLMGNLDQNSLPIPSWIPDAAEGAQSTEDAMKRIRTDETSLVVGLRGGTAKDQIAAEVALHDHRESPEHDRAVEKSLRANVDFFKSRLETARTALYDYLKSKGRVA